MAARPHRRIIIAGAGIAGLTLALALAKRGFQVTVLERRSHIEEFGAGLQIGPNARRVLNSLGMDDAVKKHGFEPNAVDVFPFGSSKPITSMAFGAAARSRYGAAYAVMHRGDLADILHKTCRRFANIDIRFGVSKFDISVTDDPLSRTRLTVNAEIDGQQPFSAHPYAFVGADGVGSRTRTAFLDGDEADYSGYTAWRTLIDSDKLSDVLSQDRTSLLLGKGFHAIAYPLTPRGKVNIALFTPEKLSVAFGIRNQPNLGARAGMDPRFAVVTEHAEWTHWPLATVETPHWHRGPIGLIGDAAHAMLPFQAQGAAMAIEDAYILAHLFDMTDSPDDAFARFDLLRRDRITRVARISAQNARIFHMSGPLAAARNIVLRTQGTTSHFKRLDWLYSYDPIAIAGTGH